MWLLLAISAQVMWAAGIFVDKYLLSSAHNGKEEPTAVGALTITSGVFVGFFALAIFVWHSVESGLIVTIERMTSPQVDIVSALFAGFLQTLWLIPYFCALDDSDELAAPPVFQTIPVFGFILGYFFFDEAPTALQLLSSVVIVAGSLILNIELLSEGRGKRRFVLRYRTLALMLLSAGIVAFLGFYFKDTANLSGFTATAFWSALGAALTGMLMWMGIPSWRREFNAFVRPKNHRAMAVNVLNEAVDVLAYYVYYAAIVYAGSTVLVQSTIAYQPVLLLLFTFVFGRLGLGSFGVRKSLTPSAWAVRGLGVALITLGTTVTFL